MKSTSLFVALVGPYVAIASVLPTIDPGSEIAGGAGNLLFARDCSANNCARAVTGTNAKAPLTVRQSDCSSFMRATVTSSATTITETVVATVTSGVNVVQRRLETSYPDRIPTYASACDNASKYSSACSCWGITATAITVPGPTVTATVTHTTTVQPPMQTLTGILKVDNADTNANLGYVSKSTLNGALFRYQAAVSQALHVSFVVPTGALSATGIEVKPLDSDLSFPFLGFVQGRDDTTSIIAPGSFHYLYFSATSQNPDGIPQNVGNSYNSVTGTSRTSESAVWNIDLVTGAFTGTWTNPDGNPASSLVFWTQSTALYAGSDLAAFTARYPSPTTPLKLTFILS